MEDWFYHMTDQGTKMAHTLTALTLWCIRKQRNAMIFRDFRITAQALFSHKLRIYAPPGPSRGQGPLSFHGVYRKAQMSYNLE